MKFWRRRARTGKEAHVTLTFATSADGSDLPVMIVDEPVDQAFAERWLQLWGSRILLRQRREKASEN